MSDTRVFVELNNDWREIELGPSTVIAQTRQVNDFGDVDSAQADHTNQFNAPKSQANRITFENADQLNSNTDIPYSIIRAKLSQYGRETLGFIIFEQSTENYEFSFYTGNADFFFQLEGVQLKDVDFDDLDHYRCFDIIFQLATQQTGIATPTDNNLPSVPCGDIFYPLIDYNATPFDADSMTNSTRNVFVDRLYPAIYTRAIVERIVAMTGYTLIGDLFSLPEYNSEFVAFANDTFQRNDRIAQRTDKTFIRTAPVSLTNGFLTIAWNNVVQCKSSFRTYFDNAFIDPIKVRCTFTVSLTNNSTGVRTIVVRALVNATNINNAVTAIPGSITLIPGQTAVFETSGEVDMPSGYIYTPQIGSLLDAQIHCSNFVGTPTVVVNSFTMKVEFVEKLNTTAGELDITYGADTGYYGAQYSQWCTASSCLPPISAKDFLKDLGKRRGITFITNPTAKTIEFRLLQELDRNKAIAEVTQDWSDKIVDDVDAVKLEYRFGNYAQTNNAKWKPDPTVPLGLGDGKIVVPDTNLQLEADLFIQSFAACETVPLLDGLNVMRIPKITAVGTDPGPFAFVYSNDGVTGKTEPRIGLVDWQTVTVTPITFYSSDPDARAGPGGISATHFGPVPTTYFIAANKNYTMSFEDYLLPAFYGPLNGMLARPKQATVKMKLTADDFLTFDHFIPVYLNKSGKYFNINGYFYINVVDGFIAGQTCKPVLILL
jgi:hypothetical protein